jgi:hypothetical protein
MRERILAIENELLKGLERAQVVFGHSVTGVGGVMRSGHGAKGSGWKEGA